MAIGIRDSSSNGPSYTTARTLTIPAGTVAGDVLVAFSWKSSGTYTAVPGDWTQIATNRGLRIIAKIASGSDSLVVGTTASVYIQGFIVAIQDASATIGDVVGDTDYIAYNASGLPSTIDSPAVTVASAGSLVLRHGCVEYAQAAATIPADTTSVLSQATAATGVSTYLAYDDALASAGAGSTAQWTGMPTNRDKVSATVVIAPGSGGGSAIPAFVHHRKLLGVQ